MYVHVTHKVDREPQSKEHYMDEQELNHPTFTSFVFTWKPGWVYHIRSTMVLA